MDALQRRRTTNDDVQALKARDPQAFAHAMFRSAANLLPARLKDQQARHLELLVGLLRTNEKLMTAAQKNPLSLIAAVDKCISLGLEPDGTYAALIPYGSEVTLQVMFQGYVELMAASGLTVYPPRAVHEGDGFEWDDARLGSECIAHKRARDIGNQPGAVIGAWVCAEEEVSGRRHYYRVDEDDLQSARNASKAKQNWDKYPRAYAQKTVLKRLAKYVPTSGTKLSAAVEVDGSVVTGFHEGEAQVVREHEPEQLPAEAGRVEEHHGMSDAEKAAIEAEEKAKSEGGQLL